MRWAEDYFEHSLENDNDDNNIVMKGNTFGNKNLGLSKFMKFMHQDNKTNVILQNDDNGIENTASKWAQEFSNQQNPDLSSISDIDKSIIDNVSDINEISKSWPAEFTGASSINEGQ